jgi:sirohydrochlorin ferrochelatase
MAPATEHAALIVAHGWPSQPEGADEAMHGLAAAVAACLGAGWSVAGATLAGRGSLAAGLARLPAGAPLLVYPHFMADGWFSTEELPRRLRRAGAAGPTVLPAFGRDPAVHALALARAAEALAAQGWAPGEAALLLAAHGHPSDPRAAASARAAARHLAAAGLFREVATGFIDQAPYLAEAARLAAPALCLPYFALNAGHVLTDLPEALAQAGFPGPTLAPIGTDARASGIIAAALGRAAAERAA